MSYYSARMASPYRIDGVGPGAHDHPMNIDSTRKMVEYKRFGQDYFSGSDAKIYFDSILVDTVMNIQFSLSENVIPVYGYKSYTFDAIARGNRIIKGSFRIAFKEAYYLHSIANELSYYRENGYRKDVPFSFKETYAENTIESILATSGNKNAFEKLADAYESAMWGDGTSAMRQRGQEQNSTSYFYPDPRQKQLHDWGFTIMITYGNIDRESGRGPEGQDPLHPHSTVETILGVQLTDVGKVIDASGQPLFEEYGFIAKDLNRDMVTK